MLKHILSLTIFSGFALMACDKNYTDKEVVNAVCNNDRKIVEKYLRNKNDVNKRFSFEGDKWQQIQLIDEALDSDSCRADFDMFMLLVDAGAKVDTPLHLRKSIAKGIEFMKYILDLGVDPNDAGGSTGVLPLDVAGKYGRFNNPEDWHDGYLTLIKTLIDYGADPSLSINGKLSFIGSVEVGDYKIKGLVNYLNEKGFKLNLSEQAKQFYQDQKR